MNHRRLPLIRFLLASTLAPAAFRQADRETLTGTGTDPNTDPNKDVTLNPAAWQDVPAGQGGFSAVYAGNRLVYTTTRKDGQGNLTNGVGYNNPLSSGTPGDGQVF